MRYPLSLLVAALTLVALPAHAEPAVGPPAASEEVGTEQVVIDAGHVDLGLRQLDGEWELMARDDTVSPPVWRHTDDVVLHVTDAALAEVPADETYAFLGVADGQQVHVIPQTENPATVWLGWNTQAPETIETFPRGADLELVGHEGEGALHLFIANGFDAPLKLWNSTEGPGQKVHMEPNTHVHANWIFTAPGVHTVDVAAHGVAADGSTVTAPASLHFAVGDRALPGEETTTVPEPERQRGSKGPETAAPSSTPEPAPATEEPGTTPVLNSPPREAPGRDEVKGPRSEQTTATGSPILWAGAGAGLVAAVGAGLLLRRRATARRDEAWKDDA